MRYQFNFFLLTSLKKNDLMCICSISPIVIMFIHSISFARLLLDMFSLFLKDVLKVCNLST